MIDLVGTGITITSGMVYGILTFGIFSLLQPWSRTLKVMGAMIGLGAYALLPLVIAGGMAA